MKRLNNIENNGCHIQIGVMPFTKTGMGIPSWGGGGKSIGKTRKRWYERILKPEHI
jgi:hypothetical protein